MAAPFLRFEVVSRSESNPPDLTRPYVVARFDSFRCPDTQCPDVITPKRPWAYPSGPAVKKRELCGVPPGPPSWPNCTAQTLSISIALPLASRSGPRNSPELGSNALTRPREVLLLIRIALLIGPKSAGARAIPHGECSGPWTASCLANVPSVLKISTTPLCALFSGV